MYKETKKQLKKHNNKGVNVLNAWDQKDIKLVKVKKSNKNFDWATYEPQKNSIKPITYDTKKINVIETTKMPIKNPPEPTKKDESMTNKNFVTSKPPRNNVDPNTNRTSIVSTSGVKAETAQDKQEKKSVTPKTEFTKQNSSSENILANNNNQGSNSNVRASSGDQQSIELLQIENSSLTMTGASGGNGGGNLTSFSKHIPGRNSFAPNQTNKIYPMRSTSFSSEKDTPKMSLSPVPDTNRISTVITNKDERENYLKQEVYPKFPQQQKNLNGENNVSANGKNAEENESITSSEIRFKQRTSPDGIESSVKRKENDEDA
jgi:hypothetical protein